jgi:integrase
MASGASRTQDVFNQCRDYRCVRDAMDRQVRWQDIDLATGIVEVVRSLEQTSTGLRFKTTKTKRGKRPVVVPPSVVEVLHDDKTRQAEERLALGLGKGELVFTRVNGQPISPDSFTRWVARVAIRAGTSHIMPVHGLRHTHITNLLRANVRPKVASERAGQSRVGFTLDRYSHVIPSLQEDAALRIDAALRKTLARSGGKWVANPYLGEVTGRLSA